MTYQTLNAVKCPIFRAPKHLPKKSAFDQHGYNAAFDQHGYNTAYIKNKKKR